MPPFRGEMKGFPALCQRMPLQVKGNAPGRVMMVDEEVVVVNGVLLANHALQESAAVILMGTRLQMKKNQQAHNQNRCRVGGGVPSPSPL